MMYFNFGLFDVMSVVFFLLNFARLLALSLAAIRLLRFHSVTLNFYFILFVSDLMLEQAIRDIVISALRLFAF